MQLGKVRIVFFLFGDFDVWPPRVVVAMEDDTMSRIDDENCSFSTVKVEGSDPLSAFSGTAVSEAVKGGDRD